jgi:uncharacterized protein YndB with AHSA1/START domain
MDPELRAFLVEAPWSIGEILRCEKGEIVMKLTDVTVAQTIPASAEEVFDVWMDPHSPGGPWFGAERVILNPAVDGLFYLAVNYEGRTWPHYGRFVRINRPHEVEYTWVAEATRGAESTVRVTFDGRGDQTEVTLTHSGVPDDEIGRRHKDGWAWVLSKLNQRFVSRTRGNEK